MFAIGIIRHLEFAVKFGTVMFYGKDLRESLLRGSLCTVDLFTQTHFKVKIM
jgi:hypothetical protein